MQTPRNIYDSFRASMLSLSDEWTHLISDDVELVGPLARIKGRAGFIEMNRPFFASIVSSELLELIEIDNQIITRISTEVKVPPRETITLQICEWYKIENEKIVSLKVYFDASDLKNALQI